ncbi:TlpA disulfide reductase family protein [uncultured Flavobacterium sp.]|uniref:TlpA family protein disulfide reductase n=1 Tax=uncultured Flavobacterium sp. TaxID=165435 RepID=UPI0030CA3B04
MKKIICLLLLSITVSFAQSEKKSTVKFSAKIENRTSDTLTIYGPSKFKKIIAINKNGLFESSFETNDGLHQFSDGTESSMMYLKDGDNLFMTMNTEAFDETIVYKGKGADENNFMAQKALKDEKFELTTSDKDSDDFNSLIEEKKKVDLESLELEKLDNTFKATMTKMMLQQFLMMQQMHEENSSILKLNGTPSPTFAYENHKGGITKLEDLRGKYVYIDVWATWCAPCRAEIPFLKKLEEKLHDKNIAFVSISIDQEKDKEKWKKMVEQKELGGIQLFAEAAWDSKLLKEYSIKGIPRFILIDPDGIIINANADRPSSDSLEKTLNNLLN